MSLLTLATSASSSPRKLSRPIISESPVASSVGSAALPAAPLPTRISARVCLSRIRRSIRMTPRPLAGRRRDTTETARRKRIVRQDLRRPGAVTQSVGVTPPMPQPGLRPAPATPNFAPA